MNLIKANRPNLIISPATASFSDAEGDTIEELRAAAYLATGETPERCFGSNVLRHDDGGATVTIYRD